MLSDKAQFAPKGWVRAEIYDPKTGLVLEAIEKHNIVTNAAAQIIASALADPSGFNKITTTESGNTSASVDNTGFYPFQLKHHRCEEASATLAGTGSATVSMNTTKRVVRLKRVTVNGADLKIGVDVWISDEDAGQLAFATAPGLGSSIDVKYLSESNPRTYIAPGSESVTVDGTPYTRSATVDEDGNPIPSGNTYIIDEETGIIRFASAKTDVSVTYSYKSAKGLAYMGISNRPEGHPVGQPVVFTEAHKGKPGLDDEYEGTRQPIIFPATVIVGSTYTETVIGNGFDTVFTLSHRGLLSIESAYNITKNAPITVGSQISIYDAQNGKIKFATPPTATDVIRITYTWNSDSTVSFIADFPPGVPGLQLTSHTDTFTTGDHDSNGFVDTSYALSYEPESISSVMLDGVPLAAGADYTISGKVITLNSTPQVGLTLSVSYDYYSTSAPVYEVGMFDALEGGNMFSISGIGPITKDVDTGMRITWSITF